MCNCENNLCQSVEDYFDGELTPEKTRDFKRHLDQCPTCQQKLQELQQIKASCSGLCTQKLPDEADLRIRHHLADQLQTSTPGSEILDLEGVAQLLKIPVAEVVKRLDELPSFEIAGRIRFRRDRISQWIQEQEQKLDWERKQQAHSADKKIIQFPGG